MKRISRVVLSMIAAAVLTVLSIAAGATESFSPIYSADDLFTERDLKQSADLSDAATLTAASGQELSITEAGVYVLSGEASDMTVTVDAGEDDKVQLVLDGLTVTNTDFPVIYVKAADKVFITIAGDSALSVTGAFVSDGSVGTDGVIFSREDLALNGTAALTLSSSENGIVGKDDLKITGGTLHIQAASKAVEANDSICIAGGTLDLTAGTDGLHAENNEDDSKGMIYIGGGSLTIHAGDDAIHAASVVQIDGGTIAASAAEGIEGTCIQINGGTISIQASDDGINAARKSSAYSPAVVINGGDITIAMGAGDTDGIDSNGDIIVNGGTISVTGNSTFDYDGSGQYNGGVILANGQQVYEIPNQMMGGGWGGGRGGWGNNPDSGWGGSPDGGWGNNPDGGWGGGSGGRGGRRGR